MGTKSGDGHANPRSLDMTTSLEADDDTYGTSRPTYHHSMSSTGRKPWKKTAVAVETPPGIRFSGTIKESADGAETPEEDTRRTSATTNGQGQSHPRSRRHTPIVTEQVGMWRRMTTPS
jgi:hypothetical protein